MIPSEKSKDWLISEYEEALARNAKRLDFLECLEACGVDNWVGFDDAVSLHQGREGYGGVRPDDPKAK